MESIHNSLNLLDNPRRLTKPGNLRTAVRESCRTISGAGAEVAGLVISLDREEIGQDSRSAVQELEQTLRIPVISIVKLEDLVDLLEEVSEYGEHLDSVLQYRKKYGINS